jgi:hypothetical protein
LLCQTQSTSEEIQEEKMKHKNRPMFFLLCLGLLIAALQLAACGQNAAPAASESGPAKVEAVEGSDVNRVTLTEEAAQRLDIQTASVRDTIVSGTLRKVIPYAAILYDTQGATWAYINPEPLTFLRHAIIVDYIDGDDAYLSDGPATGSSVVTVGAAELFGSESEFQEE